MINERKSISKRDFLISAASVVAATIVPIAASEVLASTSIPVATAPRIDVNSLREYYGNGDYGSFTGVYAEGHIDPMAFVKHIDMDDVVEMIGDKNADDLEDDDVLKARAIERLPSMVKHQFARWGRDDGEECGCGEPGCEYCDEKWFLPANEGDKGAFLVTVIDWV